MSMSQPHHSDEDEPGGSNSENSKAKEDHSSKGLFISNAIQIALAITLAALLCLLLGAEAASGIIFLGVAFLMVGFLVSYRVSFSAAVVILGSALLLGWGSATASYVASIVLVCILVAEWIWGSKIPSENR